jgi:hypothetical protein
VVAQNMKWRLAKRKLQSLTPLDLATAEAFSLTTSTSKKSKTSF